MTHTPPSRDRIAALVVTHQRLSKLQATVTRLLAEDLDAVVVFDNASTDGTVEWLRGLDEPRLHVIAHDANSGGAGGFDMGLRHVTEHLDPDWVLVSDDDGRPMPGAVAAFRAMDRTPWDAIGAAVLTPDGQVCEMNRPYRNPFWHLPEFLRTLRAGRRGFHLGDDAYAPHAPATPVDMASFVGLFLSRRAIDQGGYPDRRLFIYGDDQLYTLTLRRRGLRIGFAPAVRYEHDTTSIAAGTLRLSPIWKVYYMYRNALLAYRVAAGPWFWPLLPLLVFKWRGIAPRYGDESPAFRRLLRIAICDGLRGRLDRTHPEVIAIASARTPDGDKAGPSG
ncbi:glycosyltransferase [Paracoccus sp. 1_MG-2023]|uniref:glycosyltransferase n=1 Tax=unclassified Paracoccus (in: a-proteobacteria) TaxID=2688777 RepID=UPI001C08C363|nr:MULTISPECIES: glycosyltransferase [unclassified Paracoccus (in: a-proteobacteria)]MBU2957264.1 glycosyltransferase [Paracoccus sp. C2R09]MDO6669151.1 glycosyltransferase [Paracoccus sp. 1_MG-2023]